MSTELENTPAELAALLDDFVKLEVKRRELEEQLDDCTRQIGKMQEPLVELFAMNGLSNVRKDGLTVFLKHDRYVSKAKGIESDQVCEVLRAVGLGYMVAEGYNANSLKARVKEYEDNGEEVPPTLAAVLNIGETTKLATRRA